MATKKKSAMKDSPLDAIIREKDQKLLALIQETTTAILCDENDEVDRLDDECSKIAEEIHKLLYDPTQKIAPGSYADSYKADLKAFMEDLACSKEERAKEKAKGDNESESPAFTRVTEIHIEPATEADFQNIRKVKEWTKSFLSANFSLCGDYSIPELSITLRGFFHPPSTFANIIERETGIRWIEIDVFKADQTIETWTNIPFVLPTAPWYTRHIEQKSKVDELIKMMQSKKRLRKKLACFTASDFMQVYQNACERHLQWRASNGNPVLRANIRPFRAKKRPPPPKFVLSKKQEETIAKSKKANPLFKLSKSEWEAVVVQMDDGDAKKSLKEIADQHIRDHLKAAMKNTKDSYPECSKKELTALLIMEWLDNFLVRRGVARRIIFNDPAELAVCACLDARFSWLQTHQDREDDCYPNLWPFLSALSAGDFALAHRFTETGFFPIKKGLPEMINLYNGIFAVLRKDMGYLRKLAPKLKKPKTNQWIGAIYPCLLGILRDSPVLVAEGLNQTLATCRRRADDKMEKIISIHAHAFYHLCRWVSPELVSTFDAEQSLPWDPEYARWVRENGDPLKFIDLKDISPILHEWVHKLPKPCFWNCQEE